MQYVRCILKCQTDNNVQQLSEPIPTRLKLIIQKKFTNFWNSSKVSLVLIKVISFVEYVFKLWYRGSPDSTVFAPPGNHTIEKTILFRDWFCSKLQFMTFGFSKSPFLASFQAILSFETREVIIWFLYKLCRVIYWKLWYLYKILGNF